MKLRFWQNWAGNQRARARMTAPTTITELQEAVKKAAAPRSDGSTPKLRVAGGSYSWAPLVTNDDTIIEMHRLDRLISIDRDERVAEVECGMTIEQLNAIAAENGLTLITPTLFPRPTIGGVVATGCHGTSRLHGNFSDNVLSMKIVRHDGSVEEVKRGEADFAAAQVALGTLGVIYSVKLRLQPQFNVYVETQKIPLGEVLTRLDDLRRSNDSLEIFWWPFQQTMYVYTMNRTDSQPDAKTLRAWIFQQINTFLQNKLGGSLLPWIASHAPNFTPTLSFLSDKVTSRVGVKIQTASDAFHFQKAYPKCWDMSYAFPAEHAAAAWAEGIRLVDHYANAGLYPMNLALHGRFTGGSEGLLAPDHARETGYVEAVTVQGTPHWRSFFKELEGRWLEIEGARPHWSKIYFRSDRIAERYPGIGRFLEVREAWDPRGIFLNDFLSRTLLARIEGQAVAAEGQSPEQATDAVRSGPPVGPSLAPPS